MQNSRDAQAVPRSPTAPACTASRDGPEKLSTPTPAPLPAGRSPRAWPLTAPPAGAGICPLCLKAVPSLPLPLPPSTKPDARKDEVVVEVKSDKLPEEAGLLQATNGDQKPAGDQVGLNAARVPTGRLAASSHHLPVHGPASTALEEGRGNDRLRHSPRHWIRESAQPLGFHLQCATLSPAPAWEHGCSVRAQLPRCPALALQS